MSARHREDLLQDLVTLSRETLWHIDGVDLDEFLEDKGLQRILERMLELIGEAATRLGDDVPPIDVDWRAVKGLRVLLAHLYERVSPEQLYETATRFVPDLLVRLQRYLDGADEPADP